MFLLRDLRFVFCSRDLDVLRAQRIIGFFILITHKSTRSENPITWLHRISGKFQSKVRNMHEARDLFKEFQISKNVWVHL